MKKTNLQQKLFDSGVLEHGSNKAIQDFKTTHFKAYKQQYNKEYQQKNIRKTLIFTPEEFEFLQTEADQHQQKLSPFLKQVIFAYFKGSFVLPTTTQLTETETLLRQINQRIAESIQYVHLSESVSIQDIETIKQTIAQLEIKLTEILHQPPKLNEWLNLQTQQNPRFVADILHTIAQTL